MIDLRMKIADEHCRVVVPIEDDFFLKFEYYRHLFPYSEIVRILPNDAHLLEVGFGSGYGAGFLSETIENVTATDISEDTLAFASTLYQKVNFRIASGTSLPFENNSFDCVISFQVIEHIHDSVLFLREVFRVLKPGGEVYLTTPNRRLRLFPFQHPWNSYHVREYSDNSLLNEIKRVFPNAHMKGVMARRDLMEMEKKRVSPWINGMCRITGRLSSIFNLSTGVRNRPISGIVSIDDFFLTSDQTAACLDLFCSAIKLSAGHEG